MRMPTQPSWRLVVVAAAKDRPLVRPGGPYRAFLGEESRTSARALDVTPPNVGGWAVTSAELSIRHLQVARNLRMTHRFGDLQFSAQDSVAEQIV
jgi:hypothetical protein